MSVQFLSDEWMTAATDALGSNEAFSGAIQDVDLVMQFDVSDAPSGAANVYNVAIADGTATVASGANQEADVTVSNDYDTAVAIAKGDLNTQMAFMSGKLKVSGNLAKLMMNQNVVNHFATALASMDVAF